MLCIDCYTCMHTVTNIFILLKHEAFWTPLNCHVYNIMNVRTYVCTHCKLNGGSDQCDGSYLIDLLVVILLDMY